MKKTKKNLIICPVGAGVKIAKRLGCSRFSVTAALHYKDNGSELCNKIRTLAVEEYGGSLTSIMV